jgi:hypothetical protein
MTTSTTANKKESNKFKNLLGATDPNVDREQLITSIIGDVDQSLSNYSKSLYPDAVHIDVACSNDITRFYSLGDMTMEKFIIYLLESDKIIFHNKEQWSNDVLKEITQSILYIFCAVGFANKIAGFDFQNYKFVKNPISTNNINFDKNDHRHRVDLQKITNFDAKNYNGLTDYRKTQTLPQFWIAGCSYASGDELDNQELRYGQLVADHYGWKYSFLSRAGSSIDFAADQIIRSDIRKGDVVIVGLTGIERYTWFISNRQVHVTLGLERSIKLRPNDFKGGDIKLLSKIRVDDARINFAERAVNQIVAQCKKSDATLVLMVHEHLSLPENATRFTKFLSQFDCFLDLTSKMRKKYQLGFHCVEPKNDGVVYDSLTGMIDLANDRKHPGPMTHRAWADIIIDFVNDKIKLVDH